jgi:sulfur carrier protein
MKILLNNREEVFENERMSVAEMLEIKRFTYKMRLVRINGSFVPKENYETEIIRDGDNVQMLYLMSGG